MQIKVQDIKPGKTFRDSRGNTYMTAFAPKVYPDRVYVTVLSDQASTLKMFLPDEAVTLI